MADNEMPSVLGMIQDYSDQTGTSEEDIFKKDPPPESTPKTPEPSTDVDKQSNITDGPWEPNSEDLEGLDEVGHTGAAVYDKSDFINDPEGPIDLINGADEVLAQNAVDQMDELQRAQHNIEMCKQRLGVKHLQIPHGPLYNEVMDCATDNNAGRAAENLDKVLRNMIRSVPGVVLEWLPGHSPESMSNVTPIDTNSDIQDVEFTPVENDQSEPTLTGEIDNDEPVQPPEERDITPDITAIPSEDIKVIIDKTQASDVAFDAEERDKIKRSRTIELEIIEKRELHYNIIDESDIGINDIDAVLSQYTRKYNDMPVSLPASHYRCTLTGLSYPEILDLSYSQEQNNLDGERKKWSIAYDHIKNPSIGRFADFDDFLQKTSFIDLDFILWGILCATCMPKEIVSIDCHSKGCGNTYDWIYSPKELLQLDQVAQSTLDEMKVTGEAQSDETIRDNYEQSMLKLSNSVVLPSSQFVICFGHISAYTYLNTVYGRIEDVRNSEDASMSTAVEATALTVVKYILLPSSDGEGYRKVSDPDAISKVIHTLNELDFQTLGELLSIMTEPYQLKFVLKDIVCPKCKTKSSITIDDIGRMIFITSQSLSNATVKLKRQ